MNELDKYGETVMAQLKEICEKRIQEDKSIMIPIITHEGTVCKNLHDIKCEHTAYILEGFMKNLIPMTHE